jgi:hypothetical protein
MKPFPAAIGPLASSAAIGFGLAGLVLGAAACARPEGEWEDGFESATGTFTAGPTAAVSQSNVIDSVGTNVIDSTATDGVGVPVHRVDKAGSSEGAGWPSRAASQAWVRYAKT